MAGLQLPRLYPIVDASRFSAAPDPLAALLHFAEELIAGGATLLQYRGKALFPRAILSQARELNRAVSGRATLIMNDRADLCLAAGFDGVHLGQDDLAPEEARRIFENVAGGAQDQSQGAKLRRQLWIGFSTHNLAQAAAADALPVDYIAIGPVFPTASKANPDPVIGLAGVTKVRRATSKPLVAIGGITRDNCRQVLEAGADSVAVIADLIDSPRKSTEAFLRILG
jgi:thiamine-phosphate pyrophosphorylase